MQRHDHVATERDQPRSPDKEFQEVQHHQARFDRHVGSFPFRKVVGLSHTQAGFGNRNRARVTTRIWSTDEVQSAGMLRPFLVFVLLPPLAMGQSLKLAVSRALDGRSGTAIILSVADNRVVASYRPEIAAKRVVLPGSAVKPFVLLELLRSRKISAPTEWTCRRHVQVGHHNLDCQHVRTVEAMNAERALAYS